MLAGLDLPRPKDVASLRLRAAQLTICNMNAQGHDYIDLRQDGKRIIYLCILCLKPCYSEPILFQHLNGNRHKKNLRSVELTMRLQNPWPFNDGMVFFKPSKDEFHHVNSEVRLLEASDSCRKNAGVLTKYNGSVHDRSDGSFTSELSDHISGHVGAKNNLTSIDEHPFLVVPDVLLKGDVGDIGLKYLGIAKIGARFYKDKKRKISDKIRRIWCEWLGGKTTDDQDISCVSELDYGVVTMKYAMEISMGWEDETEQNERRSKKKKKRKSFSDPEDTSVSLIEDNDTYLKDSATTRCKEITSSQSGLSCSAIVPGVNIPSDELALIGSTSNRELRKEIRKRQRVAVRRMCEVCKHKMQPGKDVAALLNLKTGKLACSSRNANGAFHVFHVSCLLHWILFCEYETFNNPIESPKWKPLAKKRKTAKMSHTMEMKKHSEAVLHSVVCPACQGSGKHIKGAVLEKNPVLPSQMFKYIIQTFDGRREWMKDPEMLQNCSIGLHYPPESEEILEEMSGTLGLLQFFTVDDPEWSVETCL